MRKLLITVLKRLGLFTFIKRVNRSINYSKYIRVNHRRFKTLKLYGSICRIEESWMLLVLQVVFKLKHGAIWDIGMNLGQTLLEVKGIDPERNYIGFEPNPSCVMYVEELVRVNKLGNCTILPVGLFTEDKLLNLDLYEDNLTNSGGSVIKGFWNHELYNVHRTLNVPVFKFETITKSLGFSEFEILKIDVEGAELEVLQTLRPAIIKYKPIILIEILSAYNEKNVLRYERQILIEKLIRELEYKIILIMEDDKGFLKMLKKIDSFDPYSDPNNCNYIFYHKRDERDIDLSFNTYLIQ